MKGVLMDDYFADGIYPLMALFVYLIPTFIAFGRGHPNYVPILVVNLTLGWTVIGWLGALLWSLKRQPS
ncbi:MAG TPA: superinfection immunity protein [Nitrospira sp.]|nr:superinfection immunity protein [Nitrospira sp.]